MSAPNAQAPRSTGAPPPADIQPAATPTAEAMFALQIGVVVVAALYLGQDVLVPITVAVLLSFLLTPLVSLLRKTKIGRIASVLVAAVVALGLLLAIGAVIGLQLAQLTARLPQYVDTVQNKIDTVRSYAVDKMPTIADRLGLEAAGAPGTPSVGGLEDGALPLPGPALPAAPAGSAISPLTLLTNYVSPVLSPVATAGIMFMVAVFILLQKEDLRDRMIRLFGSSDLHRTTVAMDDAARRLSRYFLTLLVINVGFGVAVGTGLYLIGIPNPLLWMIMGAFLRFVPYVGPIIAAVLPIALAAAVDPGWTMVLWTAALFIVTELVFNQVVEPLAYGKGTGLSPFAVIVAAIFWGWLWGPVGLILSMPLTLCLVVLGRHVERLEFLDVLLGDRPALTPSESFYQRMLAGDPDEAQDHAEILLKERPLSSYYDEIALKGLQLAANDWGRGVLRDDQLERIRETASTLIDELSVHEDRQPDGEGGDSHPSVAPRSERAIPVAAPPASVEEGRLSPGWQGERPVLCLAGKGPLDEVTSTMLVQLLGKHGLGARVAPYAAASRGGVGELDVSGVAMVCVSYLDIGGTPSHLRYLIRRLRAKLPGVPVLVGLWPAEDSVLKDEAIQREMGADFYTTSLREAVNACVAQAQAEEGRPARLKEKAAA